VVGIDVQWISEVASSLEDFESRCTKRLLRSREFEYCRRRNARTAARRFAERFAAKEAGLMIPDVREIIPSWKGIEALT